MILLRLHKINVFFTPFLPVEHFPEVYLLLTFAMIGGFEPSDMRGMVCGQPSISHWGRGTDLEGINVP
jgi:hypothetical protein